MNCVRVLNLDQQPESPQKKGTATSVNIAALSETPIALIPKPFRNSDSVFRIPERQAPQPNPAQDNMVVTMSKGMGFGFTIPNLKP